MNCWRCQRDIDAATDVCEDCKKDITRISKLSDEIQRCKKCSLNEQIQEKVSGRGFWAAKVLFIGEAPGRHEDEEGRPFVGAAGHILDLLISVTVLKPKDYYITNVLKCRPPGNRKPTPQECEACSDFLKAEIKIIKPKIIVPLGLVATQNVLNLFDIKGDIRRMADLRGSVFYTKDNIVILPTYHPAAIIYDGTLMDSAKADFVLLSKIVEGKYENAKRKTSN